MASLRGVRVVLPSGPVDAVVTPPGSKSLTNRALLVAALAEGESHLAGCLDSEDTQVMRHALRTLGVEVVSSPEGTSGNLTVNVRGRRLEVLVPQADLYVAGSGTTLRFLAAALALANGSYRLFGTPRMHERPIAPLVSALEPWGGSIVCGTRDDGVPFLGISPANPPTNSKARIASDQSSQFLSGLLLAAPLVARHFSNGVRIEVDGTPVSQPYITMTLALMKIFGVAVDAATDLTSFAISRDAAYRGSAITIEPDASAASYFFAAAAICGGRMKVPHLGRNSLQGDVRFVELLEAMGCRVNVGADSVVVERDPQQPLRGIAADMNAISDTVQTLAVVALFADSPTTITNIAHIRLKETDRLAAVACELRRLGAVVDERKDAITITPQQHYHAATIETYQDHRMAMSFALAGLRIPGVGIADATCCEKTFPRFFEMLDGMRKRRNTS